MSHRVRSPHHTASHSTFESRRSRESFGHRGDDRLPEKLSRDYTIVHAGRKWRLGPLGFWTGASVVLTMALWSAGTASYFAFRDDLLTRLITRQADMQYAYEDRIAELRAQVDRLTSRQLLDQEQVEQRIENLARRQSTLESRTSTLGELPEGAVTGSTTRPPGVRPALPASRGRVAPVTDSVIVAPSPDRHSSLESRAVAARPKVATQAQRGSLSARLASIEESLDRVDARHSAVLLTLEDRYDAKARRIRGVLADLGFDAGRIAPPPRSAVGGPFVPVHNKPDTAPFERQLNRIAVARAHVEHLGRTLQSVPVRKPLEGDAETSSGFGVRLDPFIRAPAMHSGLDFRAPTGERVLATATGTVATAGWNGGYGRMVEIDHGNGYATRYAHLSEILVKEGQSVRPGQLIGRVGSTGRSTGPHLHYETRIDGEAVDPRKFLRAGVRLGDRL
jgi:murein DD-endopeptidase MepM/ murein hydrolase activator NlpD